MSFWTDFFFSLGPLLVFLVLMIFIYFKGSRKNRKLLIDLEERIHDGLKGHTKDINRVQIRADEYEYRCKPKMKGMKILTIHLKLVNRSFIIQWLVNFLIKEKERLFMGIKFGTSDNEEDPVYRLDLVPYRKKMFIRKRFEGFVVLDDILTADKEVDQKFMVKSESQSYVSHIVDEPEFTTLCLQLEPYLEHFALHKSKEETDPHISSTYEFNGFEEVSIENFFTLFFLVARLHLENHGRIKKLVAKGERGKSMAQKRGVAKRGGARRIDRSKAKKKTKRGKKKR